jgi:sialate O-acetylesterase
VYARDVEYSGPVYQSLRVDGGEVRLSFSHVGGGLVAKGSDRGELKTFQIAGADGNFVAANARVEGDTVIVSSPDVAAPTAVRYAWDSYPEGCNLYNNAGLPAAPFTTKKSE